MNGIKFGNIHSFIDLNLILSSVNIPPAMPKMTYIDIPGADGSLDLSEALGEIKYQNRNATFTFTTLPEDDIMTKYSEVCNALNGVHFNKITLDKDSDWYWTGRCYVSSFTNNYPISKVVVTANLNPWKRKQDKTVVKKTLTSEYSDIILFNSRKKVSPTFIVDSEATIKFGSVETALSSGTHVVLNFILSEGVNVLQAKGTGTIIIEYQEGDL